MAKIVFVLEAHGEPKVAALDEASLLARVQAGIRLGITPGIERVKMYVPADEKTLAKVD